MGCNCGKNKEAFRELIARQAQFTTTTTTVPPLTRADKIRLRQERIAARNARIAIRNEAIRRAKLGL